MENDQKSKPVFFHGTKIVLTTTTQLIDELEVLTDRHLSIVRDFQTMDHEILEEKPHPDAWNALECIHHLNLYGNYYLTERSEEHTSELQSRGHLVCRLLLEKT